MRGADQEVAATDAAWRWLEIELASILDKPQRRSVATLLAPKLRTLFTADGPIGGPGPNLSAAGAPAGPLQNRVTSLTTQLAALDESVAVLEVREQWQREVEHRDKQIRRLRAKKVALAERAHRAEGEEERLRSTLAEVQLRCDRAEALLRAPMMQALEHAQSARQPPLCLSDYTPESDTYQSYRRPAAPLLTQEHMRPWRPFGQPEPARTPSTQRAAPREWSY